MNPEKATMALVIACLVAMAAAPACARGHGGRGGGHGHSHSHAHSAGHAFFPYGGYPISTPSKAYRPCAEYSDSKECPQEPRPQLPERFNGAG